MVGGPASTGTLDQAVLMLREGPRIPAFATDAGDWLHVGLYTLLPGGAVLLFAGTGYDDAVLRVAHERGARAVVVGPAVDGADVAVPLPASALRQPAVRSLIEPLVAELLAIELWRRTHAAEAGSGDVARP